MSQQIALMSVMGVRLIGGAGSTNLSITFDASGEVTSQAFAVNPGVQSTIYLPLTGIEAPIGGSVPFQMNVSINGSGPGGPLVGSGQQSFTMLPSPDTQDFTQLISVTGPVGPPATVEISYRSRFRIYPICYDAECLCSLRYYLPIYYRWLCWGMGLPDFYQLTPVTVLTAYLSYALPSVKAVSTVVGASLPSPASDLFSQFDYIADVVNVASEQIATISWRDKFVLDDFATAVDANIADYIGAVTRRIVPVETPLCRKWRELLDCYCKICARRPVLPANIVAEYDNTVAAKVDALYPDIISLASQTACPYYFDPYLSDQCRKLRNIVNFFAWWCRRCTYIVPPAFSILDAHYIALYPTLATLAAMLKTAGLTICNPPEKDFCPRWAVVLDCLKKLCDHRDDLPKDIRDDIENTFGQLTRNLYGTLHFPPAPGPSGIAGTCDMLDWLTNYFNLICTEYVVPGGMPRRPVLDAFLLQFEAALNGFKTRNGDLCGPPVPLDECGKWMPILECLDRLCDRRNELPTDVAQDVDNIFGTLIDSLYDLIPSPPAPGGGSGPIDDLCDKLAAALDFIGDFCNGTPVDPILKLQLDDLRTQFEAARDSLLSVYPDLCSVSVTPTTTWCDSWTTIFDCLQRICRNLVHYDPSILDDLVDLFADVLSRLDWIAGGAQGTYEAPTNPLTIEDLCAEITRILAYLATLCPNGSLDPITKLLLDRELAALQTAYAAMVDRYPGICTQDDVDCAEWVATFDCLARICDRWDELAADPATLPLRNKVLNDIGPNVDNLYVAMFGALPPVTSPTQERICFEVRAILDVLVTYCACGQAPPQGVSIAVLAQFGVFHTLYHELLPCSCDCLTDRFNLTTGHAPWTVIASVNSPGNVPRPANVLYDHGSLDAPMGGTYYISSIATASNGTTGETVFRLTFSVCGSSLVRIVLDYWADDGATVYLDNEVIGSTHLPSHGALDTTRQLASGQHVIDVHVVNDPAGNMGFDARGYVEAFCSNIVRDEACSPPVPPNDWDASCICCNPAIDCCTITELPSIMRLLCCDAAIVEELDGAANLGASFHVLVGLNDTTLSRTALLVGLDPAGYIGVGEDGTCGRIRRALVLTVLGLSNPQRLPAILRHKLRCFVMALESQVESFFLEREYAPLPCCACSDLCERWLSLLRCLCDLCNRRTLLAQQGLVTAFDTIICDDITSLHTLVSGYAADLYIPFIAEETGTSCCDMLRRCVAFFAMLCLDCGGIPSGVRSTLETRYETVSGEFNRLMAAIEPVLPGECGNFCRDWQQMLECLLANSLRRSWLPAAPAAAFDGLPDAGLDDLFTLLFPAGAGANPLPAQLGETGWKLLLVTREFERRCRPFRFNAFTSEERRSLRAIYTTLAAQYATLKGALTAAGITPCPTPASACSVLRAIGDNYTAICSGTIDPQDPRIVVLEALLTMTAGWVPMLQSQLRFASTPYPTASSFCVRLAFMATLVAAAYARRTLLAPELRTTVDLFLNVFEGQAAAFIAAHPERYPLEPTAMSEYRGRWMELLGCICAACDYISTLSFSQRTSGAFADLLALFQNGVYVDYQMGLLDQDLLGQAAALGMPFASDPCVDGDACSVLRASMAFFGTVCLSCSDVPPGLESVLSARLEAVRSVTVALRSVLAQRGMNLCGDEDRGAYTLPSPLLYLQAAGSTGFDLGGDGSAKGVHLRWALLGDLGTRHLPKGNYTKVGSPYRATFGYNKTNDFVRIHRTAYSEADPDRYFPAVIDLTAGATKLPASVTQDGSVWTWTYNDVVTDPVFPDARIPVVLRFNDTNADYRKFRNDGVTPTDPHTSATDIAYIVQNFTGVIEVETFPRLMFALEAEMHASNSIVSTRMEAISQNDDPNAGDSTFISARHQFMGTLARHKVFSDSVALFRLDYLNGYPTALKVETYEDFHTGIRRRYLWAKIGAHALTLDRAEAFRRLEDPSLFTIHGTWPKFGTEGAGNAARVNVNNYKDRWKPNRQLKEDGTPNPDYDPSRPDYDRHSEQSIEYAVRVFLEKSVNPDEVDAWLEKGSVKLYDGSEDKGKINIPVLRMLLLAAQDYHVARMLGLGAIDADISVAGGSTVQRYVYMAEYDTPAQSGDAPVPAMTHRYLSLPTALADSRLPVQPSISVITYGLSPDYTDAQGYTKYGDARFVRVHRNDIAFDLPTGVFFSTSDQFSHGSTTRPIQFGIRFAKTSGSQSWRSLHPVNDHGEYERVTYLPYLDPTTPGNPEVLGIPDMGNPVFTHRIENEPENYGDFRYAIYGINIFSRASAPDTFATVVTNQFPRLNMLLPPVNLMAQYIQPEHPRVFTSLDEQLDIDALKKHSRVTFDWNHVHNIAYQHASHVQFFFRTGEPQTVRGQVVSARPISSGGDLVVQSGPYKDLSAVPGSPELEIQPIVTSAQIAQKTFVGSVFAVQDHQYVVTAVNVGLMGFAEFVLKKVDTRKADGTPATDVWDPPRTGQVFVVVENLGNPDLWRPLASNSFMLADFTTAPYPPASAPYTEVIVDDGQTRRFTVGGLYEPSAQIVRENGPDVPAGVYKITCTAATKLFAYDVQYPVNPLRVSFYKGTARVPDPQNPGRKKAVEVMSILPGSDVQLVFYVYDPEDTIGPHNGTGTIDVNFHPSYRAYLVLTNDGVQLSEIEPQGSEASRQTFIAARAVDVNQLDQNNEIYASGLTRPAVHVARRIVEPVTPEPLNVPEFATRPDFYGKSSCSLDLPLAAGRTDTPYALVFYRGDEQAVLRALYSTTTLETQILPNLKDRDEDPDFDARWAGLVSVEVETSGPDAGKFKQYGTFRFPPPDNPDVEVFDPKAGGAKRKPFVPVRLPGDPQTATLPSAADDIREVLAKTFVPLTDQPVLFSLVHADDALATSSARPILRDDNGDLLQPTDPRLDAYPMVRWRNNGGITIRFTDYSLDGASRNVFFYCARELSNTLAPGKPSTIAGPVKLVNTTPPLTPDIRHVRAETGLAGLPRPAVAFTITPYAASERIETLQVYRAATLAQAASIRTMTLAAEIPVDDVTVTAEDWLLRDEFADIDPPYGAPVYYRLVAVRTVRYTHLGEAREDAIASHPSDLVLVNIVDTSNPPAPVITATYTEHQNGGVVDELQDVVLSWHPTLPGGSYTLYAMGARGNWKVLASVPAAQVQDPMTYQAGTLVKLRDGATVYHRFKVVATNSYGLQSKGESIKTL